MRDALDDARTGRAPSASGRSGPPGRRRSRWRRRSASRRRRWPRVRHLVAGREAGAAAAAQARRGDRRDRAGRAAVAGSPSRSAVERAGARRAASRSRRVGRRPDPRGARIVGQRGRGLQRVAVIRRSRLRPARRCRSSPRHARPARRRGARRTALSADVGIGRCRRLEPEVAVVRRRAVDHRVPRPGRLADPLERRDREVAVRGLGRLEDLEHLLRVVVVARRGSRRRGAEVDRRRSGA